MGNVVFVLSPPRHDFPTINSTLRFTAKDVVSDALWGAASGSRFPRLLRKVHWDPFSGKVNPAGDLTPEDPGPSSSSSDAGWDCLTLSPSSGGFLLFLPAL